MIYNCYLDDSKDQKQEQMIISAGFYGTQSEWGSVRLEWRKRLLEDGLEYFKTSEYKSLDGQFAKFKTSTYPRPTGRDAARKIRSALLEIIKRHPQIQGVGVAIPVQDYKEVCSRPEAAGVFGGDPYHRALESVIFETAKIVRKKPGRNMVAFVHDDGPDFDQLRAIYKGFVKFNPGIGKACGGFQPLDDKLHPPLQTADMIANFTLGIGQKWLEDGRTPQKKTEMKENISLLGIWETRYMLSILRHELKRWGKPIPLDLESEEYG
jgi:hypothetical protein